jgi:3,4-dihydroxy 2-butanone 4-phosphate synthase/GTP cyclohydrolase II
MQDKGIPVPDKEKSDDLRTYGIGAQILIDLGVKKMKVLSTPKKMHALSGFELEVIEYIEE